MMIGLLKGRFYTWLGRGSVNGAGSAWGEKSEVAKGLICQSAAIFAGRRQSVLAILEIRRDAGFA